MARYWCVVAVMAAVLVCCGGGLSGRTVQCKVERPCLVSPMDTALLSAQHPGGVWRVVPHHGSIINASTDPIIDCVESESECAINEARPLTNLDSGIYYYNYTTNGSHVQYERVNVTVLAPPSLTSVCDDPPSCQTDCHSSVVVVSSDLHTYLNVSWYAIGPVNVTWTHNGTQFDCEDESVCVITHRDLNSMILRLTLYPSTRKDIIRAQAGQYRANVSNPYGWNTSIIEAIFKCPKSNQIDYFSKNDSIKKDTGEPFEFTCKLSIGSGASLYVCYVAPDESLADFDPDIDCARCTSDGNYCFNITNHPQILVSQVYDTCMKYASVVFGIESLANNDSGTFYCGWIDGTQSHVDYYTNVSLAVSSSPLVSRSVKLSLYIALPLSFAIILLIAILIIRRTGWKPIKPVEDPEQRPLLEPDNNQPQDRQCHDYEVFRRHDQRVDNPVSRPASRRSSIQSVSRHLDSNSDNIHNYNYNNVNGASNVHLEDEGSSQAVSV